MLRTLTNGNHMHSQQLHCEGVLSGVPPSSSPSQFSKNLVNIQYQTLKYLTDHSSISDSVDAFLSQTS